MFFFSSVSKCLWTYWHDSMEKHYDIFFLIFFFAIFNGFFYCEICHDLYVAYF